jgi:uncharacterized protein YutE (UPF0331/DUF86 family)
MVYRPESIERRLAKLGQYAEDLAGLLPADFESYVTDRRAKYAIERLLLLITETVLDILDHALSAKHEVVSDGYEDILRGAHAHGILSTSRFRQLEGIGGFRNVLAHEYLALRDEEVYAHAVKLRDLLPALESDLESIVADQ